MQFRNKFGTTLKIISYQILKMPSEKSTLRVISSDNFNKKLNGKEIRLFTIKNTNGLVAQITNFGGVVVALWVPDRNGNYDDIVLGYDTIDGYLNSNERYFGAIIGRCANRIAKGKFTLDGINYNLATNNGKHHLHGGYKAFNEVVWDVKQLNDQALELTYVSPDGEEGYPGALDVKVIYHLTDVDEFKIEYWATTDKATPVNLTHHSFFNLLGAGNGSINDHIVQIDADYYTTIDGDSIPTGEMTSVAKTPLDFRKPVRIGDRINTDFQQLKFANGYDHNWILNQSESKLIKAATVFEEQSGRTIEVITNEPGIQFYTGNYLNGNDIGKNGKAYHKREAFCLETQQYPDGLNHKNFPSIILKPDEEYHSICIYRFGIQ